MARGYAKMLGAVRHLIYLEDQYLWSEEVAALFAQALAERPELRLIAVVPRSPDQDGRFSQVPQLVGRAVALRELTAAGGDRVAVYSPENHDGTPVYVHAKVCVADDSWATVGSDNLNLRSWTYDSELSCAVVDEGAGDGESAGAADGDGYARRLRLTLAREHLDRSDGDDADLRDPRSAFDAFTRSAEALDEWYAHGRSGERPPGRLRRYEPPELSRFTMTWARPLYRLVFDPDGRPADLRKQDRF